VEEKWKRKKSLPLPETRIYKGIETHRVEVEEIIKKNIIPWLFCRKKAQYLVTPYYLIGAVSIRSI